MKSNINKINNGLIISPKVVMPMAVLRAINNIPGELLLPIDENDQVAKEKCILLLSVLDASKPVYGWRCIHNTLFSSQCGPGYTKIIAALRHVLPTGKILQGSNFYIPGVQSKEFRINLSYFQDGYEIYEFTQPEVIKRCLKNIKAEIGNCHLHLCLPAEVKPRGRKMPKSPRKTPAERLW